MFDDGITHLRCLTRQNINHARRQADLLCARRGTFAGRADDAVDRDPKAAERLDVDRTDESGSDHGGPDLGE